MKAFISYSHQDSNYLEILHKHLAQLKRDNLISAWTDQEIMAGGNLDTFINSAINNSKLFIALISPDYINSNYCYEKEFQMALELQEKEQITIIPIIVEPCDWHNTPLSKFKALPKDGKAVSLWENTNTAFLDVVENLRKLIKLGDNEENDIISSSINQHGRNYRVQKDFDSIEKIEFVEKTFNEVRSYLNRYIQEIIQLENIKSHILENNESQFNCIIVNRNKIATEAHIKFL